MLSNLGRNSRLTVLLTWFLTFLWAPTPGTAIRFYRSRAHAIAMLGGKEAQIQVSSCRQSSNTAACAYATDASLEQEPSQCALTSQEDRPYWIAMLQGPAYVTMVTILNMDISHMHSKDFDGLTSFMVMISDDVCYNYISNESFSQQKIPCDAVGDEIVIQSDRPSAVLALCDVQILGVLLKFPTLLKETIPLPLERKTPCAVVNDDGVNCLRIIDGVHDIEGQCAVTEVVSNPWFELHLDKPSIVHQILVYSKELTGAKVLVNNRKCDEYTSGNMRPWIVECEYFGDTVRIVREVDDSLALCEVQVFGYVADFDSSPKYRPLGCHKDDEGDRDLPKIVSSTRMTIEKCYRSCKHEGTKYFGVQMGKFCFCGSSYAKHGAADESSCNSVCQGEPSDLCGGKQANHIYEIV